MEEKNNLNCEIAIIGIGLRFPGDSSTPNKFWQNLLNSFDGIVKVPKERWSNSYFDHKLITSSTAGLLSLEEWKKFDPLFFGISPKDASHLDPQERMMLTCAYEALEDAQIPSSDLKASNTGVFVGVSLVDYASLQNTESPLDSRPSVLNDFFTHSTIANRVSYFFDFRGPSLCVDTACASSLYSVDLAIQHIRNGDCDVALGCGVNAIFDPTTSIGYSQIGVLNDHCLSFDANGKGFVRSEGCGVVVLKKLSDAERDGNRIYAVIKGRSTGVDGRCNKDSLSTPSSDTQAQNINKALASSNTLPSEIYYVEAHATGTVVGDPIEVKALSSVFTSNHTPESPLKIGSVKANIGHLESGSGIASLIKVALMLKNRKLVPNIKITTLNPKIPFKEWNIEVVRNVEDLPSDRIVKMGVNSFGIGGANCHMVLQEYSKLKNHVVCEQNSIASGEKSYMVPISGNSINSVEKYCEAVKDYQDNICSFKDFAIHQSLAKSHHTNRKVIIAKCWDEFHKQAQCFKGFLPGKDTSKKIIFVFCGQGPQSYQMGLELYETEPIYKKTVDGIDSMLKEYAGYSIISKLSQLSKDSDDIHKPIIAQPALFLFQVGLAELLKSYGISPSIVLGHSFGDITSAYLSGNISLNEAVKVVHFRSLYQNETIGSGRMLVVNLSSKDYESKYKQRYPNLEIACYNSHDSIVITGSEADLKELSEGLKNSKVFNTFLRTPCSFHSSHQKSIKSKVLESLKDMDSKHSSIPWYSTVTGQLKTDPMDSKYLYKNLRKPVYFQKTLQSLFQDIQYKAEDYIFVEIAPHPTLSNLILQSIPTAKVISPIQRNRDEQILFKSALSSMYCFGASVDFKMQFHEKLENGWKDRTSILPRYQWDSELFWEESSFSFHKRTRGPSTSILGNLSINNGQHSYHSDIDIKRTPYKYLSDHCAKDKPLFPGAAYVDAIIEAFKNDGKDILINQLEFLNPFFLEESIVSQKFQTAIDKISNNQFKIQFFNKNGETHDIGEPWIKSAHSDVSLIEYSDLEDSSGFIDSLKFKNNCCISKFTKEEFYKHSQRLGLKYGPSFQHVKEIYFGDKMSFSVLSTRSDSNEPNHILNATLIDNCAHGLIALIDDRRQILLKSFENLQINMKLLNELESKIPEELYLLTTIIKRDNYSITGNCLLVIPETGKILMEIERIMVGTSERLKMKEIKYPSKELFESFYQTKDSICKCINPAQVEIQNNAVLETISKYAALLINNKLMEIIPGFSLIFQNDTLDNNNFNFDIIQKSINFIKEHHIEDINLSNVDMLGELDCKFIHKLVHIICEMVIGNETSELIDQLFKEDYIRSNFSNLEIATLMYQQTFNIIKNSLNNLNMDKKVVKILDISGGLGLQSVYMTKKMDELLQLYPNTELSYTFAVSNYLISKIKSTLPNQFFKSNFKFKFMELDLNVDATEQHFLISSYDIILAFHPNHLNATNIGNMEKLLLPNGIFIIDNHSKFEIINILNQQMENVGNNESGMASQLEILNEKGIVHSLNNGSLLQFQKSPISQLPIPNIEELTLVIGDNQIIQIDLLEKYSNKPISIVKESDIDSSSEILQQSSLIIFLLPVDQLTVENYKRVTFSFAKVIQLFTFMETQPKIISVSMNCNTSNYFANSIVGFERTAHVDHGELDLLHIDIDSPLNEDNIKQILQLSLNQTTLGEFEYFIKDKKVLVSRFLNLAEEILDKSNAYEKDQDNIGCKLNLDLKYKLFQRESLSPFDIEFSVKSVGLNFKDYLYHHRLLSQEFMSEGDIYHPPYGLEASGIVTRIGENVTKFKVGDEVACGYCDFLKSHATCHEDRTILKPGNISFNEASIIPVVYKTVYYALFNICKFNPENETLLIHSATGGVGLATLNLMRWLKCKKVYATAGSKEKIAYLKSNYPDILIDVFDSHSFLFAKQIKRQCKGVDVLINTLSVEFMASNFKAMAPWGRIADLSLTHVHNGDPLDFGKFKNDISYSPIDFKLLVEERRMEANRIYNVLFNLISKKELDGLPFKVFPATQTKEAVLSMKERTHIGKIVVDLTQVENDVLLPLINSKDKSPIPKKEFNVDIKNSIIVTGQQGISSQLISWLAKHTSASNIIVLSKSKLNCKLEKIINTTKSPRIQFYQVNVCDKQELKLVIQSVKDSSPPVESIFHLAAIYDSKPIMELDFENIESVHNPKVLGAVNLHEVSMELNLPISQFIAFSSISGVFGSASQPSYNSANTVLDSLCNYRNSIGLYSKSIRWGPLLGEGQVADSHRTIEYFLSRGIESLPLSKFFGGLEAIISQPKYCNPIIGNITTFNCFNFHPHIRYSIDHLVERENVKKSPTSQTQDASETITNGFSTLLSIPTHKLLDNIKLRDFGVDSMRTVQIKFFLDMNFEKDLFNISQIPSQTIESIVSKINTWKEKNIKKK